MAWDAEGKRGLREGGLLVVGKGASPDPSGNAGKSLRDGFAACLERGERWKFNAAQKAMDLSGMAGLYVKFKRVRGAVILMYHAVPGADTAVWHDPRYIIPPESFDTQMRFLRRYRKVIPYRSLVEILESGENPPAGTAIITFDDGYRDILETVAPIMARYRLPAIMFLPTGCISRGDSWNDRLYTCFRTATAGELHFPPAISEPMPISNPEQRAHAYEVISAYMTTVLPDKRDRLLRSLLRRLNPSESAPRLIMNWDEVRQLINEYPLFDLGAHTVEHLDLTVQEPAVICYELRRCITDFRRQVGWRPEHFAFPYNRSNALARQFVKEYGFRSAVCSGADPLVTSETDLFGLPRIEVTPSLALFRFQTSGAYPGLSQAILRRS
jgi:peptidoglycan/xylan/chitin deacetylase (PgdA/CDA1 family)